MTFWTWFSTVFLTNDWWFFVWNHYSMTILGVPAVATFVLKVWAVINPNIPSNQICDLITQYWPTQGPNLPAAPVKK